LAKSNDGNKIFYTNYVTNGDSNLSVANIINNEISYKFNKNLGTTAHDFSGNSNDGTITGAIWTTDGALKTLTALTDYTINPTTGLFTIVNDDYSWSWMNATWSYDVYTTAGESNNEGILALVKLIEGIKFLISAVFFGAVIYIIINWGFIKNKINQ